MDRNSIGLWRIGRRYVKSCLGWYMHWKHGGVTWRGWRSICLLITSFWFGYGWGCGGGAGRRWGLQGSAVSVNDRPFLNETLIWGSLAAHLDIYTMSSGLDTEIRQSAIERNTVFVLTWKNSWLLCMDKAWRKGKRWLRQLRFGIPECPHPLSWLTSMTTQNSKRWKRRQSALWLPCFREGDLWCLRMFVPCVVLPHVSCWHQSRSSDTPVTPHL